ncbi:hypothetical protein I2I05_18985 [Hymenobacter sp. BT683]|uniref:Replication initiation protein n=1 Tax=Hymenobacter jeongseonensis TaxID=2791027 RepID=A0ABS0IMD6_9BACT|nr:hypothetical protein [Hymenobacter jeongseonensis]MBF9239486.1 hypothetical protein [Hymenobacter jeongseonensis]
MLPLPLTLAKARRLWHQDFEAQCAAMPLQLRSRTHQARLDAEGQVLVPARTEHYYVQPKAAPATAKELMTDLVFMSVRALERSNREPGFDFAQVGTDAAPQAPPIAVNCKSLGKRRSMSSRSVRTHIDLLLKMGALVRKAWHGTRADFELWINPKYVWQAPEMPVESDLDRLQIGAILNSEPTKFPLSVAFETLETRKLETSQVDKLVVATPPAPKLETQATLTGNTGPQPDPEPLGAAAETGQAGARRRPRAEARKLAQTAASAPKTGPTLAQKRLVMSFWAYARPQLYGDVAFDEAQHAKAQNAIWFGVFAGFQAGLSEREYELYHQQALERVDLVADWLKRNPGRFLPAPYAEIVKGRGYFDRENGLGFVKTEEWLAQKMLRRHEYHVATTLRRAGAEMRGWRLKTAGKRVLALTAAQLYHKHLKKVQALRDPRALDKFYFIAAGGKV